MRFNVKYYSYYTESIVSSNYKKRCILVSKESYKWRTYVFSGRVHALSGLTFESLENELRSLDFFESGLLEDFSIDFEISIPNLNYLYSIVKAWEETGQFRLSDYYDILWYNGGNST